MLIAEFLCRKSSVRELILKSNKIGDDGMSIIAEALEGYKSSVQLLNIS